MNTIAKTILRLLPALACLLLFCAPVQAATVKMDILFMNHGPMQPVIKQIKDVLAKYSDSVQAAWHDEDTPDGTGFMKRMNIKGHIPLMVFVNGSTTHGVDGKQVTFTGFPSGAGPFMFQGAWGMKDLDALLSALTKKP
jgi:hypothetical protein